MKRELGTKTKQYFDDLYTSNPDPWDFETSEYEHLKYTKTLTSLPRARYQNALEVGCSIGVLTQQLAQRCDRLLAIDISEVALGTAKKRLHNQDNVTLEKAAIPDDFPAGAYDLVLLSEVGYYLCIDDLSQAKEKIKNNLITGGDLILIHWTHFVEDYPITGDQVHELFIADKSLRKFADFRSADYRLDVLRKI